jgi:putative two-component system hydrogenase maturation factor HypX/HoxX
MKILLVSHAYNCLCQRLHIELAQLGHDVSIEFDINDDVCIDAVECFQPDLIIAPFLKRAIPDQVWQNHLCWIVHPGIIGDRGPSSLDWAILNQEKSWGVTILQANEIMDGGDIWATEHFAMRIASKSSLYRQEVTSATVKAIRKALSNLADKNFKPTPLADHNLPDNAKWRCLMKQSDRAIDWQQDDSETILRKINSSDGNPGLLTKLLNSELKDREVYLYNAAIDHALSGQPGHVIAQKNNAIAIATIDSAIWVSHLSEKLIDNNSDMSSDTSSASTAALSLKKIRSLKLPAALLLNESLAEIELQCAGASAYKEVWHHIQALNTAPKEQKIAYLYFNFYNGAMSTSQCQTLLSEYQQLAKSDVDVIILMGGNDFFSNGIHLNVIEQSDSAADESWRNINAMNDVCQAIIETTDKLTVAAINGNVGAGGVFLALSCDLVAANEEVVLNPHYKSMGNLFGSEYWTYTLPERIGLEEANKIMENRLPVGAIQARELGLIDFTFTKELFLAELIKTVKNIISNDEFSEFLHAKLHKRQQDESQKPLSEYRTEELAKMKLNFYGFDPSYHVARYHFVYKLAKARTPSYLAKHRQAGYKL